REQPLGNACLYGQLRQRQRGERGDLRRFHHDGVPRRERWRELAGGEGEGEVPWNDAADDADRCAADPHLLIWSAARQHLSALRGDDAGEEAAEAGRARDLTTRLPDGLTRLG